LLAVLASRASATKDDTRAKQIVPGRAVRAATAWTQIGHVLRSDR
jgi:hypothetical protein